MTFTVRGNKNSDDFFEHRNNLDFGKMIAPCQGHTPNITEESNSTGNACDLIYLLDIIKSENDAKVYICKFIENYIFDGKIQNTKMCVNLACQ